MKRLALGLLVLVSVWNVAGTAWADRRRVDVELAGDVAYLTNGRDHGTAIDATLRVGFGRHFALGLDVGYGVILAPRVEDRWWIVPTASLVVPLDALRLDVGAGIGAGAASGYRDLDAYAAGPFDPDWAYQLAPAIVGHVMLAWLTGESANVFVRLDAGVLAVDGNELGVREQTRERSSADTAWLALSVGAALDL